jgi:tRNA U34 5-methylaminomethyl-2-thiouridine-forming methyltransferase MnmC
VELKSSLRTLHEEGSWRIHPALEEHLEKLPARANLVLYDAYSKKTSPELWDASVLTEVIRRMKKPGVFCTYAANSVLKRTLKSHGFILEERTGFAGKRESTLAYLI